MFCSPGLQLMSDPDAFTLSGMNMSVSCLYTASGVGVVGVGVWNDKGPQGHGHHSYYLLQPGMNNGC